MSTPEPVLCDQQRLFVTEKKGKDYVLTCLDRFQGKALWEAPLPKGMKLPLFDHRRLGASDLELAGLDLSALALSPTLVGDRLLYVGPDYECVMLESGSGRELRRIRLGDYVPFRFSDISTHPRVLSPLRVGDTLVLSSIGKAKKGGTLGMVHGLDAATGELRWEIPFPGVPDLAAEPAGNSVLVGGSGTMMALDPLTGKTLWTYQTGTGRPLDGACVLAGTCIFLSQGRLFALDARTGKLRWSKEFKGDPFLLGEGDRLILTEHRSWREHRWVIALDAATGNEAWSLQARGTRLPWVEDGRVLFNQDESLVAVALADGKALWRLKLERWPPFPLQPDRGVLYQANLFQSGGLDLAWKLRAIDVRDGREIWTCALPERIGEGPLLADAQGILYPARDGCLVHLK